MLYLERNSSNDELTKIVDIGFVTGNYRVTGQAPTFDGEMRPDRIVRTFDAQFDGEMWTVPDSAVL